MLLVKSPGSSQHSSANRISCQEGRQWVIRSFDPAHISPNDPFASCADAIYFEHTNIPCNLADWRQSIHDRTIIRCIQGKRNKSLSLFLLLGGIDLKRGVNMKNDYRKVGWYALLIVWGILFAVPSPDAHAADSQDDFYSALNGITSYIKEDGQQHPPVPNRADVQTSTDSVYWGWWVEHVGGWSEQLFAGHRLGVRIGFINGGFDQYAKTYKAEPVVQLKDLDKDLTYPYVRVGQSRTFIGEKLKISLEFNKPTITIRNNLLSQEQKTIQYSELLQQWTELASRTCLDRLGRKICLFSQTIWDGTAWRYGFVATEGTPLYYTTNLPQEFVELYKSENGERIYKPIAYSPALLLAFMYVPRPVNGEWNIRKMTDEELGEVIVGDRSRDDILLSDNAAPAASGVKDDAVQSVK